MHAALDMSGHLPASQGPGVYALLVSVPNAVDAVQRTWMQTHDNPLPDAYAEQLAEATDAVYVGASGNVYKRLMDHARSDVRQASFVAAFDVTGVLDVWPGDRSGVAERDKARLCADATTVVWCDGSLF
jgi:hypothetical protein